MNSAEAPTVSVIIPAFNAAATIQRTIGSVVQQSFTAWELIVIDDGSTDRTAELVREIRDDRIRLYSIVNAGVAAARNFGIEHASGSFIAFLDADDSWATEKLMDQHAALLEDPAAGLAYSWTLFIDDEGLEQYRHVPEIIDGNTYGRILVHNFLMCGSTPLVRKEAIEAVGHFDASMSPFEDWDYFIRLARYCRFALVPRYQIFYRQSDTSASAQLNRLEERALRLHEKAFREAPDQYQASQQRALAQLYYYLSGQYANHHPNADELKRARHHFLNALRLDLRLALRPASHSFGAKLLLMHLFPAPWLERRIRWVRNRRSHQFELVSEQLMTGKRRVS